MSSGGIHSWKDGTSGGAAKVGSVCRTVPGATDGRYLMLAWWGRRGRKVRFGKANLPGRQAWTPTAGLSTTDEVGRCEKIGRTEANKTGGGRHNTGT